MESVTWKGVGGERGLEKGPKNVAYYLNGPKVKYDNIFLTNLFMKAQMCGLEGLPKFSNTFKTRE
jgi:hypothetical protein